MLEASAGRSRAGYTLESEQMSGMEEERLRARAEKKVDAIIGFWIHLAACLIVNTFILLVWLVTALAGGTWWPWFLFPLVGWGMGVVFNAWVAFGTLEARREKLLLQEIEKMRAAPAGDPPKVEEPHVRPPAENCR